MNKIILFLLITILFNISASAAVYKGQVVFVKRCASCHKDKEGFIKSKTIAQWSGILKNDGEPLLKLHLNDKKAKKSWAYFNSKKYAKKVKHLKDFLVEYAKDSGKVPACN